ncbi:polysaccharide biosynthesis protein [Candidatus Levyibacteriota bacterium]|nr:polysaccharide biosynthesis protein [Candidatus Levybacteria bacterium]
MKILLVSSFLPYPLFSGGQVRLYNLIKQLSKKHNIILVCEKRSNQTEEDVNVIKKLCTDVIIVDRKRQWSFINILITIFSSHPFLMVGHNHYEMKKKIEKILLLNNFDLIHVETFYVMQNVPNTQLPMVLVEHNIEYLVYQRFVNQLTPIIRFIFQIDVEKLRHWENFFWKKATKLVAVSETELNEMKIKDAVIVPNGVDIARYLYQDNRNLKEKKVLYIGDFKWLENQDSAKFIITKIWPIIKTISKEKIILWIVGKNIPNYIRQISNDETIVFDENADDTVAVFKNSSVLLAPIRVGGGTSFKILESMAMGVPVVTTPLGISGIKAKDNEHALVGESPEDLAKKVCMLLSDEKSFFTMTRKARNLIENEYNWENIAIKLEDVYKSVII